MFAFMVMDIVVFWYSEEENAEKSNSEEVILLRHLPKCLYLQVILILELYIPRQNIAEQYKYLGCLVILTLNGDLVY